MFQRSLSKILENSAHSVLLLGPRQVGKSTLVGTLKPDIAINLADEEDFFRLAADPGHLRARLAARSSQARTSVCIDEVQRLPRLLNTVQALIDENPKRWRFLLTGSSARKLRRGKANLLPGRIHTYHLGALTLHEAPEHPLEEWLAFGGLPGVVSEPNTREKKKTLRSYASSYLKEEIQAEALTRNLDGFARFIRASAEWSGRGFDASKLSRVIGVPRLSVMRWAEILEDTLLARRVEAFAKSLTRRLVQHPHFYCFDLGVLNGLLGGFDVSSDRRGLLFEHFFLQQLCDSAAASDVDIRVSTFRTTAGAEVDFIVEANDRVFAVELKASNSVQEADGRHFSIFKSYYGKKFEAIICYAGTVRLRFDDAWALSMADTIHEILD